MAPRKTPSPVLSSDDASMDAFESSAPASTLPPMQADASDPFAPPMVFPPVEVAVTEKDGESTPEDPPKAKRPRRIQPAGNRATLLRVREDLLTRKASGIAPGQYDTIMTANAHESPRANHLLAEMIEITDRGARVTTSDGVGLFIPDANISYAVLGE